MSYLSIVMFNVVVVFAERFLVSLDGVFDAQI